MPAPEKPCKSEQQNSRTAEYRTAEMRNLEGWNVEGMSGKQKDGPLLPCSTISISAVHPDPQQQWQNRQHDGKELKLYEKGFFTSTFDILWAVSFQGI
jgi:hypothetical protein